MEKPCPRTRQNRFGWSWPAFALAVCLPEAWAAENRWESANPAFRATARYPDARLSSYNGWACLRYRSKSRSMLAWREVVDNRRKDGIYANALVEWNLAENAITLAKASNYSGGTYEPMPSYALMPEFATDTTPAPRHAYDALAYADSADAAYLILGAMPRVTNFDGNPDPDLNAAVRIDQASTWKYDFAGGRWRRIPSSIREFWNDNYCSECVPFHDNHLAYWPSQGKLIFVGSFMPGYGRQVAEMDLKTERWAKAPPANAPPFALDQALSAWDSRREAMVFRNGTHVCRYDAAARTFSALPDCGLDADPDARPYYTDIEYIPAYDAYFAVGRNGVTRVYDNAQGAWKTVAQDAAGLALGDDEGAIYLEYDPAAGAVALSAASSGTFGGFRTFRYVPDGASLRPRPRKTASRGLGGFPAATPVFGPRPGAAEWFSADGRLTFPGTR